MLPLEQEVDLYLSQTGGDYRNNCASPTRLDFTLYLPDSRRFFLEVKEKRQPTNTSQWPYVEIPDTYLFILDDLSARKILKMAPNSGLVVRVNYTGSYYFFDVVTLWLAPRVRVNRVLNDEGTAVKGKWMLDLRNGIELSKLSYLRSVIMSYLDDHTTVFNSTACYGDFLGEEIPTGGEIRTSKHRALDYNGTR